jgi:diguanylate cyclase (GGDEF)-like protein
MITKKRPRILIVDDEKMNLKVLAEVLKNEYSLILAGSGAQALKQIHDNADPDLILLDVMMPEMGGYEVIKHLKEDLKTKNVPVIFVTALDSIEDEEHGLKLGAVDYICKPFSPPIVQMRVRNHLRFVHQYRLLDQLAHLDGLTEIPNRRRFEKVFKMESSRAARNGTPLSLAMVDVDFFKQYNDHYGHATGDVALQAIAKTLQDILKRPADLAARYGGEEFVMVLPETDIEAAKTLAERARIAIADLKIPHGYSRAADHVSVSIGVVTVRLDSRSDPLDMLRQADQNLYHAKQNGRNRIVGSKLDCINL